VQGNSQQVCIQYGCSVTLHMQVRPDNKTSAVLDTVSALLLSCDKHGLTNKVHMAAMALLLSDKQGICRRSMHRCSATAVVSD
jgi:hypothetical protein